MSACGKESIFVQYVVATKGWRGLLIHNEGSSILLLDLLVLDLQVVGENHMPQVEDQPEEEGGDDDADSAGQRRRVQENQEDGARRRQRVEDHSSQVDDQVGHEEAAAAVEDSSQQEAALGDAQQGASDAGHDDVGYGQADSSQVVLQPLQFLLGDLMEY